ncbi:MAG: hypothetical protein H0T79_05950 [Deltaproteobacteria bacterium]|nr:hypothetical protein [Deltaproteobacteria bacterium]
MHTIINVASLVGLLGLAVGCAQPPLSTEPINITHDVCGPIVLAAPTATEPQLAAIDHAMTLWHARGVEQLTRGGDPAVIDFVFQRALPGIHGLYDDDASRVYINQGIVDPDMLAVLIAHELGHAFGLVHVDRHDRSSVMNPGNLEVTPTDEDQQAIEVLWGDCMAR